MMRVKCEILVWCLVPGGEAGGAKVTPGREAPVGPTRLVCGGSRVPYDSNIVKEEKKSIDAP
jgi:hypothetical protein